MRTKMHGKWQEATRHEDMLQSGIADVSYVCNGRHGWIELKHRHEWPKRESTIVRLDHYTDAQRIWLKHKGRAGGFTWLFLQVERDYLLFDWLAAQSVGSLNRDGLEKIATAVWLKRCNWDELTFHLGGEGK